MAEVNIPTRKLNSGHEMPMIGYGTGTALFKRGNFDKLEQTTVDSIKTAINLGFRHLDGAELYNTEPELGEAIRTSGIPRSSLFITTKVWNTIDDIPRALDQSLSKLGLDYVDLYLIHAPWFAKTPGDIQTKWKQMEEIARSGKARSIGVSNYIVEHLEVLLQTAEIVPAINQVEFHPYLQRENLVPWSEERGIVTSAFGPLSTVSKGKGGPVDDVVARLAEKYGVGAEAILLRWCVDQGIVPITTSSKEKRLRDYLEFTKIKLTDGEVAEIGAEGKKKHLRFNNFQHTWDPNDKR